MNRDIVTVEWELLRLVQNAIIEINLSRRPPPTAFA